MIITLILISFILNLLMLLNLFFKKFKKKLLVIFNLFIYIKMCFVEYFLINKLFL
jgi:hypothetical protein